MIEKLFSGVFDKDEMTELWNAIVENGKLLASCDYHDFTLIEDAQLVSKKKYQCDNCGGTVDGLQHKWHELGRRSKDGR